MCGVAFGAFVFVRLPKFKSLFGLHGNQTGFCDVLQF
jgi:hypothetical protein